MSLLDGNEPPQEARSDSSRDSSVGWKRTTSRSDSSSDSSDAICFLLLSTMTIPRTMTTTTSPLQSTTSLPSLFGLVGRGLKDKENPWKHSPYEEWAGTEELQTFCSKKSPWFQTFHHLKGTRPPIGCCNYCGAKIKCYNSTSPMRHLQCYHTH